MRQRPQPPEQLFEGFDLIVPAFDLVDWFRAAFIDDDDSPTWIDEHQHLQQATIAAIWTNVACRSKMATVVGMAEVPTAQGNVWQRARHDQQLRGWFGDKPDFLLTFYAPYAAECSDAQFCSVVDHELCHCGQQKDPFGFPKFTRAGKPVFSMRAHDVEEFTGVADRWGVDACAGDSRNFVQAANRMPRFGAVEIDGVCGTCARHSKSR